MFVLSTYPPRPPSGKRRSFHSRWWYSYSNSEGRKRVDYLSGKTFSGGLNLHLGFSVVFSFIWLRVIEHTCQFLKRGLDQPHSVLGCCGMGAEVDDRGRRERWRESGTRDLSREIVFPWMHRWWNWAVFGHSSQTRRPEKRGALGMVYYLRQIFLWSERPTLLHALLYEEGRRHDTMRVGPHSGVHVFVLRVTMLQRLSRYVIYANRIHPLSSNIRRSALSVPPPPSSFAKVVSESIFPIISH